MTKNRRPDELPERTRFPVSSVLSSTGEQPQQRANIVVSGLRPTEHLALLQQAWALAASSRRETQFPSESRSIVAMAIVTELGESPQSRATNRFADLLLQPSAEQ